MPSPEQRPPPRMFVVEQTLDRVQIRLPRRVTSDRRKHRRFMAGVLSIVLLASLAGCLVGPLIELVSDASRDAILLVPLLVLFLSLAPYLALLLGHRAISSAGEVILSQKTLRLVGRTTLEVPLESVRDILVVTHAERGLLRLVTTDGEHELFDGLFHNELVWLADLIREHAQRKRLVLTEEGHDVDAVPQVPEALSELVRRT